MRAFAIMRDLRLESGAEDWARLAAVTVTLRHLARAWPWQALRTTTGAILCLLLLAACGDKEAGANSSEPDNKWTTGVVLEIEAASLLELTALDVLDESGRRWHFVAGGYKGFPPSHLREHMLQGLPVSVRYHESSGTLVMDEVTD